jgi:alpha-ketoglutaric semialdehyde dehydrogenase
MQIGGRTVRGAGKPIYAYDPATGEQLEQAFGSATADDLAAACTLAAQAFRPYRLLPLSQRAEFLETIGRNIEALGDELIVRAMQETGLPRGRLEGERGRTVGQLRLFADVIRDGAFLDARIETEIADRKPARRPDIREQHIGLGPVAVFGASNFPLAFSVAGGDTASALAAGCPVIVKAHSAHPGTSELVGQAVQAAVRQMQFPEGVFSLLFDGGFAIGTALVAAPQIKAVGFTGSRRGGMALFKIARERPEPIPFYGEMSSINPVILLPGALKKDAAGIGNAFVSSLTLGAGQFCTNPGLVLAIDGPEIDAFETAAAGAVANGAAAPMLTAGIKSAFTEGVSRLAGHQAVRQIATGVPGGPHHAEAALFGTTAGSFQTHDELGEEVFGAASLVVRCKNLDELVSVLEGLEGQLTAAIHMTDADSDLVGTLLPVLEEKVGRILINGFGTGVEVCHAMVHGGPFPATSDSRTSSVGSLAIRRFLRPVAYQDLPDALRPDGLKAENPLGAPRLVNGKRQDG